MSEQQSKNNTRRVLILDDDPRVLDHYRQIFNLPDERSQVLDEIDDLFGLLGVESHQQRGTEGYQITLLSQGLEGVQEVGRTVDGGQRYTHALIDMRMPPGINGFKTAQRLREIDPGLKIIFVTAYMDYSEEQLTEQLPDGYQLLRKPFETEDIWTLLQAS